MLWTLCKIGVEKNLKIVYNIIINMRGMGCMKSYSKYFSAFTLAEMMVVLLIMSIVLACMAPVMTTKMKVSKHPLGAGQKIM